MKCPHCGSEQSRVTETRASAEADRRIRLCKGCGRTFQTLERVCVLAGRAAGYIEIGPPIEEPQPVELQLPEIKAQPETVQTVQETATETVKTVPAPARFVAQLNDELLAQCTAEAQPLLVEWWNVSRRSKHKSNATWTQGAWAASITRVSHLPAWQQVELAKAGVEHGWQSLKPDYISSRNQASPIATGRPMPKDPAMLAALESWHSPAA